MIKTVAEYREKPHLSLHREVCYKVMLFGLKDAVSDLSEAMTSLFHDMIYHEMEVYTYDLITESREEDDHIVNLRKVFNRLRISVET